MTEVLFLNLLYSDLRAIRITILLYILRPNINKLLSYFMSNLIFVNIFIMIFMYFFDLLIFKEWNSS